MKTLELKKGIRLTCPACGDSSVFTPEEIEGAGGSVFCDQHASFVEMVNLAELIELWGKTTKIHPDDFEVFEEVDFYA